MGLEYAAREWIRHNSEVVAATTRYLASVDDRATLFYFLDIQEIGLEPKK